VHPDPALLREAVLAGIVPVRPSGTPLALGMRRSYRQVVQWIKPPSRLAVRAASVLRRLSSMRQAGPVPPGPPATTSPVAGSPMQPPTVSLRRASSSGGGGGFDVASGAAAAGASVTEAPIMAVSVPVPVATTVHVLAEAAMDELVPDVREVDVPLDATFNPGTLRVAAARPVGPGGGGGGGGDSSFAASRGGAAPAPWLAARNTPFDAVARGKALGAPLARGVFAGAPGGGGDDDHAASAVSQHRVAYRRYRAVAVATYVAAVQRRRDADDLPAAVAALLVAGTTAAATRDAGADGGGGRAGNGDDAADVLAAPTDDPRRLESLHPYSLAEGGVVLWALSRLAQDGDAPVNGGGDGFVGGADDSHALGAGRRVVDL